MEMNYFKITVYIKDRARPLSGFRQYPTRDYNVVYELVKKQLLKYYYLSDILKIDVWWVPPEAARHISKKADQFPG